MLSPHVLLACALLPSSALAGGAAPVAEAGLGLYAEVGSTVELDGSGSADPEGDALTWTWTQVGGPPVELVRPTSPRPQLTLTEGGTYRVALVVSDDLSASEPDVVEIVAPRGEFPGVASGCATGAGSPIAAVVGGALIAWRRRPRR